MGRYVFKLPDVGEGIAESEIAEWRVKVGDVVKEDQPLVDMLTDKASVEISSPVSGTIIELCGKAGAKGVPEGAAVAAWENAMAAYHERRFADAAARFAGIAAADPADGAARVLAERARVLAAAPPPPDWDGVYEQRSK